VRPAGALLHVDDIHTYYGPSYVLQGVSLEVAEGEAVVLLGRNGAGKTTTLKSIMGVPAPRSGRVVFDGADIAGRRPYEIARRGISLVPDTRRIIPNLSVYENLKLAMLKDGRRRQEATLLEMAYGYFPRLAERASLAGGSLSGGEQQMLAIARALVARPKLLLIDEPTEGLMPVLVATIAEKLADLARDGMTMLCVETNLDVAIRIAQRVYVMEKGLVTFSGTKDDFVRNVEVQQRYLGVLV
jgi:branched-chain amino acid transport system ATP-binding protein